MREEAEQTLESTAAEETAAEESAAEKETTAATESDEAQETEEKEPQEETASEAEESKQEETASGEAENGQEETASSETESGQEATASEEEDIIIEETETEETETEESETEETVSTEEESEEMVSDLGDVAETTFDTNYISGTYSITDGKLTLTLTSLKSNGYGAHSYYIPWYDYISDITSVDLCVKNTVTSLYKLFSGFTSLESVDFGDSDMSAVMSVEYMFYNCMSLKSVDFSKMDMSAVTSMKYMFYNCTSLESLDMSKMDLSAVTSMDVMLYNCTSLESLDMSDADLSAVTGISSMCYGCTALTEVNLSGANLSSLNSGSQKMLWAFGNCTSLESLDMSGIDLSSLTSMERIFSSNSGYSMVYGCMSNIGEMSVDLSNAKLGSVTTMSYMFAGNTKLSNVTFKGADIGSGHNNGVTMSYMFNGCTSLTNADLSLISMDYATSTSNMFNGCTGLKKADMSSAVFPYVTDMSCMFYGCTSLESLDMSGADLSAVTNISSMCYGCTALTEANLSGAKLSAMTSRANMLWAFGDCENLESLDMSGIDLSSLTSMERIFSSNSGYSMVYGCITLIGRMSIDLSGAKLSKVETMDNMFDGNTSLASVTFKGADIGGSSKNGVTMSYMFSSCTNLASVDMRYASSTGRDIEESTEDAQEESIAGADLSAADLSQVTDMEYMFYNCTSLESIGLTGTVLGSVTNVNYMLNGCEKITTLDFSATDMTALTSQNAAYMLKGITELKIIYAPVGLAAAVNVPDNGTWYIAGDTSGEPITVIPQNQSESVRIYNGELADDEDLGDALEEGETEEETEEEESEESERAKLTVDDTTEDSTESGSEESEDGTESGSTESGDDTESGSTESGDGSTESGSAAKSSISLKSSEITVTAANLVETGKPQYAVTVTYIYKNGSKSYRQQLTEGVHYTVKIASGGTTAGEALVEITGTGTETDLGTFKDTETATYTILQKADAKSDVAHNIAKMKFSLNSTDLKNNTYTGLYITPAVENAAGLVENTDYTVSYKNNVNAGKATVTVMGIAPYYGTKTLTFTIKKADITKQSVSFTASNVKQFSGSGKTLTATAASSFAYSKGKAVTLKNLAMTLGDVPMSALEDYTVSYKNNTKPGTATATVKGMNNLSGSIKITYPITAASDSEFRNVLTGSSATKPLSAEYSSKGARLTSITVGSTKLLEGTDYTVKYPGDTDASVTTVTVTGKGVYKNVKKVTAYIKTVKGSYHIKSGAVVDSSKISTSETAKIIKAAKITDAEGKLIDADTVTLTVGTSSITVTPNTGNTNYQKTVLSCRYAMKLSSLKQGSTPTKYFDGVNSVTLTKTEIAGALGVSENDFTVISYKNNHKTGTAQVTVTAKSSSGYYGTKTVKFKIAKQP